MCVVSMIGDHYGDKWDEWKRYLIPPNPQPTQNPIIIHQPPPLAIPQISKEEFEALKKEVENMKELLRKAKIYDEKNNEPNCEIDDKMKFLKAVAKLVGIDLDDVLKPKG